MYRIPSLSLPPSRGPGRQRARSVGEVCQGQMKGVRLSSTQSPGRLVPLPQHPPCRHPHKLVVFGGIEGMGGGLTRAAGGAGALKAIPQPRF